MTGSIKLKKSSAKKSKAEVAIIMGSESDWPTMKAAAAMLKNFGVNYEAAVVSAHRTPELMFEFARTAADRGIRVIIAGAGGAAHLPGMVAAVTPIPVIGVPVVSGAMSGLDALYSIVQMPKGVPVATVAIGNSTNAGILAAQILAFGGSGEALQKKLLAYKKSLTKVARKITA